MEPRIQYAKTQDGVNIAYTDTGGGPPLVRAAIPGMNHAQRDWEIFSQIFPPLAQKFRLILYDWRGTGLSDRDADDFSLEAMTQDLDAVVDSAGLEQFALFTFHTGSPGAVTYAAAHPERVSHLILVNGFANRAMAQNLETNRLLEAALELDWTITRETFALALMGFENPKFGKDLVEHMGACISQEAFRRVWETLSTADVTSLLPAVLAPTLISFDKSGQRRALLEESQALTAGIPNAKLVVVDEANIYESAPRLIEEFVLGSTQTPAPDPPQGMTAILFVDIADSTALTTKLGDAAYRERERELDALLRSAIKEAAGTPVEGKVLGDGIMSVFTSARQAIDAAQRCRDLGNEAGLPLHLGIHAGDVVREGNNVHGGAVQVAARVQAASAPGEILVSDIVRGLARTSAGVDFEDRGEHDLKGIPEPQRLFAVRPTEEA